MAPTTGMTTNPTDAISKIQGIMDSLAPGDREPVQAFFASMWKGRAGGRRTTTPAKPDPPRGRDSEAKEDSSGPTTEPDRVDHCSSVIDFVGLFGDLLPAVKRQPGADTPKMDSRSIRRRMSSKRAEAQKFLTRAADPSSPDCDLFRCLNAVQALRIAIEDSLEAGEKLHTDPIPKDRKVVVDRLMEFMKSELLGRTPPEVLPNGFFSDREHRFSDLPSSVEEGESESDAPRPVASSVGSSNASPHEVALVGPPHNERDVLSPSKAET